MFVCGEVCRLKVVVVGCIVVVVVCVVFGWVEIVEVGVVGCVRGVVGYV